MRQIGQVSMIDLQVYHAAGITGGARGHGLRSLRRRNGPQGAPRVFAWDWLKLTRLSPKIRFIATS